ncbi:MAG: prepilin-type N-terminal cleavage/methylation domain-containing protein [Gammaproteobacteria bacterium]|uniref:PulJ/GspJ family protein n=1 Tax=Rhodoferax sp. TaxID=50421 RepID=UPI0017E9C57E|nr:prepilin-type N-terminal cleavage/methylation domain-containing protein [Rhodoferax sp.]MBU3900475.1 prepilin-type N-terminal cleavage/methylation domain-containing protein [Gammaproteobacteria bacterium]MBA3059942.1 prepilin-type N-terminal cleavage/methylation domain-containing protein [Rhodoferax sp.]MBU3997121.1 prepilin-type N-terminal cleavage/methylation domain-containing protein [Gammaproteobacteria bacterium]MBU4079920.1 prepilin-type N-terminal cleavage/methylation domain-containin
MRQPAWPRARAQGFTLIELLVAISLMALMAALSWRGLDGMTRAQTQMRQHSDQVLTLQAGLAQWGADLDALATQPNTPSLDWDGRALRILRRSSAAPGEGLRVVAWSRRLVDGAGQWLRWQSPPVTTRGQLQLAWQQAALWGQNPSEEARSREVRVVPLDQWQIFYFRDNAWSNPMSSAGAPSPAQAATAGATPDGVRLVLTLPAGQAVQGRVTRDWVRPALGAGK